MRAFSQRGVTLVETLVYVVISAIVLTVLTLTMRNVNKGFVEGARTVRMQQGAREAVNIMAREISKAGLKHGVYKSGGDLVDAIQAQTSLIPGDSSSFSFLDGGAAGRYDRITVRMARLDKDGQPQGVDTVTYQATAQGMLQRKVNTGSFEDFCPNVDAMQFQFGIFAKDTALLNQRPPAGAWTKSGPAALTVNLAATRMVLSMSGAGSGMARYDGGSFNVTSAKSYFAEVSASADPDFFANAGVLEIRVLDAADNVLHKEAFLPGHSQAKRALVLTPSTANNCKLAVYIKTGGRGAARISAIRFGQADLGKFDWKDAPVVADKKRVRAVRLMLMARTSGQGSFKTMNSYQIGNATVSVSDKELRRYYEEEIPVPNNGVF